MFLMRNLLDPAHQIQILLKILALKPGRESAVVIFWKVFKPRELAGEETASQWAVRYEANA